MARKYQQEAERAHFVGVFPQVRVRHLTGSNVGFERTVKEPIAMIWEMRGQVEILGPVEPEPAPEPEPDKDKKDKEK